MSKESGASLSRDELVGAMAAHQERTLDLWCSLTRQEWARPSRNGNWTNHDTARHVADGAELLVARLSGEEPPRTGDGFDPNTTPDLWLAASADETPQGTIERYAAAVPICSQLVAHKMDAGDPSTAWVPYGEAHWTALAVHVLWDSWLHERDVALPLGQAPESTPGEQRIAALYGLFMSMVPMIRMGLPAEATVQFTGPVTTTVTATHDDGRLESAEVEEVPTSHTNDLVTLVDSLSGRGDPPEDLLPGCPDALVFFAAFLRAD